MEWSSEACWTVEDSLRLAKLMPGLGVDILDVSSAGIHESQKIKLHPDYQLDLAHTLRSALREQGIDMIIAAVGLIETSEAAMKAVQVPTGTADRAQIADLAFVGRQLLREPNFFLRVAREAGVEVQWPFQFHMALRKRR